MSYSSQPRYPYGLAVHPAVAGMTAAQGVPGMAVVPGMPGMSAMPGMTAMQVQGGIPRAPNGMSGLYQAEKAGLYPAGASPGYQSLSGAQASLLAAQSGSLAGQPSAAAYYGTSMTGQPTYIPVTSPTGQQRFMVSPSYGMPGTPSGAAGYPLTAGAGYTLQSQSSMAQPGVPVAVSSLSSQAGSQYPTYIGGSQLTPLQISPSQNPYAASATGHPLYPSSAYASLQMQPAQVQVPGGQIPSHLAGRVAQVGSPGSGAGLSLGYPSGAPQIGSPAFYQAP